MTHLARFFRESTSSKSPSVGLFLQGDALSPYSSLTLLLGALKINQKM